VTGAQIPLHAADHGANGPDPLVPAAGAAFSFVSNADKTISPAPSLTQSRVETPDLLFSQGLADVGWEVEWTTSGPPDYIDLRPLDFTMRNYTEGWKVGYTVYMDVSDAGLTVVYISLNGDDGRWDDHRVIHPADIPNPSGFIVATLEMFAPATDADWPSFRCDVVPVGGDVILQDGLCLGWGYKAW
jgi:hypothetical protein